MRLANVFCFALLYSSSSSSSGAADLVWKPLEQRCSLEDYWHKLTVQRTPTAIDGKSILFIGDSLDKYILRDFCTASAGRVEPGKLRREEHVVVESRVTRISAHPHAYARARAAHFVSPGQQMVRVTPQTAEQNKRCCSYPNDNYVCKMPQVTLASLWLMGVSLDGPYYTEQNYIESALPLNSVERIKAAGPLFIQEMGGRSPDLVVVRSLFWDLARLTEKVGERVCRRRI